MLCRGIILSLKPWKKFLNCCAIERHLELLSVLTRRKIPIKVWMLTLVFLATTATVHKYISTPDLFSLKAKLQCSLPSHDLCRNLILNFTGDLVENTNGIGRGNSITLINTKKLIFESRAATKDQAQVQLEDHLAAINKLSVERITTYLSLIDDYPLLDERSTNPKLLNFDFNRYSQHVLALMQIRENDNKLITIASYSVRRVAPNIGFFVFSWSVFCLTLFAIPAFFSALAGTSLLDNGKNKNRW